MNCFLGTEVYFNPEFKKAKSWTERNCDVFCDWKDVMKTLVDEYCTQFAFTPGPCTECSKFLSTYIIRCLSCNRKLCSDCDFKIHYCEPFHNRWNTTKGHWRTLMPGEFVSDEEGNIYKKGTIFKASTIIIIINSYVLIL